jgi:hypothetical protein
MTLLAEIMNSPDFGEVMFLIAFILFLIEVIRLIAVRGATWGFHWLLVVAGLACMALGWLALNTGGTP